MTFDLIIVGGGASGTAVLQALADRVSVAPPAGLRVALLERSETPGPGLPYGEAAHPLHTMGRTRTLRREKGQQLRARLASALAKLNAAGVEVALRTSTEVQEITRGDRSWSVLADGDVLHAPRVVLATGHWHVERLRHLSRAVDWRWDVRRLHAGIADHEDVVVLGMGQSGLDVAVALGEKRRGVAGAGKIHLASRLGLLPGVFGHIGPKNLHGVTRPLEALLERTSLRATDVFAAVRAGAEAVAGPLPPFCIERRDSAGLELLRRDVAAARDSLEHGTALPWHPVLWHGMELFHELLPRLPAEDRLSLAAEWTQLMRHAEAIHLEAAERILRLSEEGLLDVTALGEDPVPTEDEDAVSVRGALAEVRGHRIVDARGPDPRLGLSDDRLLRSLLEAGELSPARIPFLAPPTRIPPEGWSIESGPSGHWLVTGGLWVDPATFAALTPRGETRGLYALGPLTLGQFPFYAGLWATRRAAERIIATLPLRQYPKRGTTPALN